MQFCNICQPKVSLAFKFFNDIQDNHNALDIKLQLEEKLMKTSEEINSRLHQHISKPKENPVSATPVLVNRQPAVNVVTNLTWVVDA